MPYSAQKADKGSEPLGLNLHSKPPQHSSENFFMLFQQPNTLATVCFQHIFPSWKYFDRFTDTCRLQIPSVWLPHPSIKPCHMTLEWRGGSRGFWCQAFPTSGSLRHQAYLLLGILGDAWLLGSGLRVFIHSKGWNQTPSQQGGISYWTQYQTNTVTLHKTLGSYLLIFPSFGWAACYRCCVAPFVLCRLPTVCPLPTLMTFYCRDTSQPTASPDLDDGCSAHIGDNRIKFEEDLCLSWSMRDSLSCRGRAAYGTSLSEPPLPLTGAGGDQ